MSYIFLEFLSIELLDPYLLKKMLFLQLGIPVFVVVRLGPQCWQTTQGPAKCLGLFGAALFL